MKPTDEYKVCSLEEAEAFAKKRRKDLREFDEHGGSMSYHGKLQTLKNGTADVEIQQWAYQQLENGIYKSKPLTDQEIDDISDGVSNYIDTYAGRREFARAIERRHGIK